MMSLYKRFFDQSLELLATANSSGYFVELNPAWESTLGFSRDELRAKPFVDFVHPDDKDATLREAARLFQGELTVRFENRYQHKDGTYRWLEWVARVSTEDGLIFACARDITRAKRALADSAEALAQRNRLTALADNTSDFIGIADLEGRAVYVNRAGMQLYGTPGQSWEGMKISDFHPPSFFQRLSEVAIPHAAQHGTWSGESQLQRVDGVVLSVSQVVVAMRDERGTLLGFGTIMRDVSEIEQYKKLEHELRTQQASLTELVRTMSTPIIPITDQIVVMPLIGSMDHQRAEQFLESALRGAEVSRARFVIMDITGLRHIDTSVAGTLIKVAAALGLLGTRVVLTGIRAELAQTLVGLGISLNNIMTHSTLQGGIAYALNSLGQVLGQSAQRASASAKLRT